MYFNDAFLMQATKDLLYKRQLTATDFAQSKFNFAKVRKAKFSQHKTSLDLFPPVLSRIFEVAWVIARCAGIGWCVPRWGGGETFSFCVSETRYSHCLRTTTTIDSARDMH